MFKDDIFQKVKEENPNRRVIELTKIISDKWRAVDEKTRTEYYNRSLEAQKQYEKDTKEYEDNYAKGKNKKRKNKGELTNDTKELKKEDIPEDNEIVNFDCEVRGSEMENSSEVTIS